MSLVNIPVEMIEALHTPHCAGTVVDSEALKALREFAVQSLLKGEPVYQLRYKGVGGSGAWADVTAYQYKMLRKDKHYEARILYTQADTDTITDLRTQLELAESCLFEWRNSLNGTPLMEHRNLLVEISNWLVCSCIATPQDMAQSFVSFHDKIEQLLGKYKR